MDDVTTEGLDGTAGAAALLEIALREDRPLTTQAGPWVRPVSASWDEPPRSAAGDDPAAWLRVRRGGGLTTYKRACDRGHERTHGTPPVLRVRRREPVARPGSTGVPPLLAQERREADRARAEYLSGAVALAFLVVGLARARARAR